MGEFSSKVDCYEAHCDRCGFIAGHEGKGEHVRNLTKDEARAHLSIFGSETWGPSCDGPVTIFSRGTNMEVPLTVYS